MIKSFLEIPQDRIIYRNEYFFIIKDAFPVSPGHMLIISNDVKVDYFELSKLERDNLSEIILKAKELIETDYAPDGYNIGMNFIFIAM
jgi:diadenosine tetraphosphate (Ap4A) HIT family hydrolase